jgi:hypothetical protein
MLQSGDGFTLCEECFNSWLAVMFAAVSGIELEQLVKFVSEDTADPTTFTEDTETERAATKKAAGKRSRRSPGPTQNGTPTPTGEDAEGVGEPETPAPSEVAPD